jgi:hypothetical protein
MKKNTPDGAAKQTAKSPRTKTPRISELTSVVHFDDDERFGGISGPKQLFIDNHARLYLRNGRALRPTTLIEAGEWYLRSEKESQYSWRGGCGTILELALIQLRHPGGWVG